MRRFFKWLDENLLFVVAGFLLAFIPLFPKVPLLDVIPGYIVRIRLEDFLIAGTLGLWLIQLWRRKASFGPNPLAKPILVYLTIGVLSMLSAVFITRTVPIESLHIGKMVLHFLRRVEYFSLFFVFYSSVKSVRQVKIYVGIIVATILAVTIYGYGQKYLYWPAFSTMNREFAKGWTLYLTQHARVLSTFGGHYDLAAYAMMALVLLWGLFFSIQRKILRFGIFIILGGVFWLLILTASRTSFLAYLGGVSVLFFLFMYRRGIMWAFSRWIAVIFLSIIIMLSFGDLSDRFTTLLKLDQRIGGIKSLLLQPIGRAPSGNNIALLENNLEAVTSKSDQPPSRTRPTDVYEDIPLNIPSKDGQSTVSVNRTYSNAALLYDLSTGIRLDALWPRALAGFKRNPLLGTGYSTLTKTQVEEFTEAESTDNDYLRALGETGLAGFLAFAWILGTIGYLLWRYFISENDQVLGGLEMALGAVVVGLLINAFYIDVFEASKVAFTFWSWTGVALGTLKVMKKTDAKPPHPFKDIPDWNSSRTRLKQVVNNIVHSHKTYLVTLLILAYALRLYKIHEPLADWHSWRQADTSAVTRNFIRYGMDPFFPRYDDLSSIGSGKPNPEGYRFVEFPLYNMMSFLTDKLFPGYDVEHSGRLTSIFASLASLTFLYLLTRKYFGQRVAYLSAFFFAVLPYNIFWSRVILPEPTLVMLTTGLVYFFDKWLETEKIRFWILAIIFSMAALLVKFTAVFFAIPIGYMVINKWGWKAFKNPWLYGFAVLTIAPFVAWRFHIARFPEGIPAYQWLFNGNGIRFKGAWFWWLFAERIGKLILGGWGLVLLGIGIVRRGVPEIPRSFIAKLVNYFHKPKTTLLFHFWLLAMLLYLVVFATGNVQHDYYQIILVPILCVFLALGADYFISQSKISLEPVAANAVLIVSIIFMHMFGWYQVRDLYNINHPEIVAAGGEFERKVPNLKSLVVAPYDGDTAFLYQTKHRGWPVMEGTIDDMIKLGAQYYISVKFDDLTLSLIRQAKAAELGLESNYYKIISLTDSFAIIQLVADNKLPK